VANPALGRKFACHNCGTKFYDLNKPDPKCPKCGATPELQSSEAAPKASRGGKRSRAVPAYEPKVDEEEAAFDDEDAGPAFEDDDAAFEDDDAAFEDDEMGEGDEEGGGEEEET
jgi:uncharacterized protein (TIGR02300 family)